MSFLINNVGIHLVEVTRLFISIFLENLHKLMFDIRNVSEHISVRSLIDNRPRNNFESVDGINCATR